MTCGKRMTDPPGECFMPRGHRQGCCFTPDYQEPDVCPRCGVYVTSWGECLAKCSEAGAQMPLFG